MRREIHIVNCLQEACSLKETGMKTGRKYDCKSVWEALYIQRFGEHRGKNNSNLEGEDHVCGKDGVRAGLPPPSSSLSTLLPKSFFLNVDVVMSFLSFSSFTGFFLP